MNIPVFALVDTNSDPNQVDFPVPANDDAFKSINLLVRQIGSVIEEGLSERKRERDDAKEKEELEAKKKADQQEVTE